MVTQLPDGVRLLRTLTGHLGTIGRIAWSPDGRLLVTPLKRATTIPCAASSTGCASSGVIAQLSSSRPAATVVRRG